VLFFIDFGIVLGSRIFIKEGMKGSDSNVQEGDVLLKINNHSVTDGMTLKEARRLIESAKDKLSLTVRREGNGNGNLQYSGSSEPTSLHNKGSQICFFNQLTPPRVVNIVFEYFFTLL